MGVMRRVSRPRRGFTLVEVLIVLAILVMLVAMVVPRFLGARKQGEIRTAKTQIGMFQTALEHYAADAKSFPTTEQGLAALLAKPSDLDESTAWEGPYLNGEVIPKDPWGQDYHYEYPPTKGTARSTRHLFQRPEQERRRGRRGRHRQLEHRGRRRRWRQARCSCRSRSALE